MRAYILAGDHPRCRLQLGLLSAVKRPVGWEKKRRLRSKDIVYKGSERASFRLD